MVRPPLEILMDFVDTHGQQADLLGRSDYIGTYHDTSYGSSDAKQAEREKVLDFMASVPKQFERRVKLLSFPGLDWVFERMLLLRKPEAHFVGLEHSVSAYIRSRVMIPGLDVASGFMGGKRRKCAKVMSHDHAALSDRHLTLGNADIMYSRRSARDDGKKKGSRANRLVLMNAETYMTMLATDFGATMAQKDEFNRKFYQRTAAWLDFTGSFCKSMQTTIEHLPFCMEATDFDKPVVITLLNGRDNIVGTEKRVKRILSCQPLLTHQDHWTYTGKSGVSMLTICATMR